MESTHEYPKVDNHLKNDCCEGLKTYRCENWSLNITGQVYIFKSNAMCTALKIHCKESFSVLPGFTFTYDHMI
jgi:hypothetical protein